MKSISERMKEALELRNMKQADLVEVTGIGKSSISTYLSGDYEPKQRNIYKIAKALDVSEPWLMGHDVPMERTSAVNDTIVYLNKKEDDSSKILVESYNSLNNMGKKEALKRVSELALLSKYRDFIANTEPDAAHEIEGATEEEKQHDNDIMDDDNF